jgi:hypothetical protein
MLLGTTQALLVPANDPKQESIIIQILPGKKKSNRNKIASSPLTEIVHVSFVIT